MGLSQGTHRRDSTNMNKFVPVVCLAAMAAAAPLTTISLGGELDNVDTNSIVERILAQLDAPIDNAIQAALAGSSSSSSFSLDQAPVITSFQGTVSQGPAVTVQTSGTL